MSTTLKAEKVQLRLERRQKTMIAAAARCQEKTLTQFMVENACIAAQQTLADQLHLTLSAERWRAFAAALDRPEKRNAKLSKLMRTPGVFDANQP